MTLKVDCLRVRLPRGFESRSAGISAQIDAQVRRQNWEGELSLEHLQLSPVCVSPEEGDEVVAQKVVAAIVEGIEGRKR